MIPVHGRQLTRGTPRTLRGTLHIFGAEGHDGYEYFVVDFSPPLETNTNV